MTATIILFFVSLILIALTVVRVLRGGFST